MHLDDAQVDIIGHVQDVFVVFVSDSCYLQYILAIAHMLQLEEAFVVRCRSAHVDGVGGTNQAHVDKRQLLVCGIVSQCSGNGVLSYQCIDSQQYSG